MTGDRCKHMIRRPHECRDCEAEAAAMSPDEGLRAAAERLATVADSLYHFPDQPRTEDDKRAIAAVINALAASGEGGSTSALRASAPEGQDDHATLYAARIATETTIGDLARDAEIRTPDVSDVEFSRQPLDSLVGVRYLNALGRRLARVVYRASEEAGPSRGAVAPLAPEGTSDREACIAAIPHDEVVDEAAKARIADAVLAALRERGRLTP